MQRRAFLEWTIRGLGAIFAAVLGVPAAVFLADPRNRPAPHTAFRTVAALSELQIGLPREFVIRQTRRDAWTLHPEDVVGRVWLVRRENASVECFSTICPHLGCSIDSVPGGFLCPCHGARFDGDGKRVGPVQGVNPAPRDMDRLPVELAAAADRPGDFEIKVEYKRFKTSLAVQEEDR